MSPEKQEAEPFDEFDPRGSVSGVPFGSVSGTESLSMFITHCFSLSNACCKCQDGRFGVRVFERSWYR